MSIVRGPHGRHGRGRARLPRAARGQQVERLEVDVGPHHDVQEVGLRRSARRVGLPDPRHRVTRDARLGAEQVDRSLQRSERSPRFDPSPR